MRKKPMLTIVGIALVFMLTGAVGAVSAHGGGSHACDNNHPNGFCPDGETCGIIGSHYAWESCHECPHHHEQVCSHTSRQYGYYSGQPSVWHDRTGKSCPGGQTCSWQDICTDWDDVKVYDCHEGPDYRACDGSNHEQHRTLVNDYGCIAVTCPAIPCEEGFHCTENQCVPDVCGEDFTCDQGFHCGDDNTCVVNPSESSGVLPACYQQDVFQTQFAPSCQGLGTQPVIPLISLDSEPLYISVTHNGAFSVQLVAHDPETDLMFASDCTAVNYFKSSCNVQRLCSGGGTLTITDRGTRDFNVVARPNFNGDVRPFQITVTNHFVDFSETTSGPSLDKHFLRTMDLQSCRYWLGGIQMFGGK